MKHVSTLDPAIHEFRGATRVFSFVSVLCFTFGVLTLFALLNGARGSVLGGYSIVAVLVCAGAFFAFFRSGLQFDTRARRYRRRWSCLVPLWVKEGSLEDFEHVVLTREIRRGDKKTYTVFPVRLEGSRKLNFTVLRTLLPAHRHAEDLARTLHLTLVDKTSGRTVVRDPEHLDEPLRDRVQREGRSAVDPGEPPPNMRTQVETEGGTLRLHIPARGFRRQLLLAFLPLVFFDVALFFMFVLPAVKDNAAGEGGALDVVFLGAIGIFLVLMPIIVVLFTILSVCRTSQVVEANPSLLRVETKTPLFKRAVEIPTHTLEELQVSSGGARVMNPFFGSGGPIVARSDARSAMFGGHLAAEEKEWIRNVLEQVLSA